MTPKATDHAIEHDLPQRSLSALTGVLDVPRPNPFAMESLRPSPSPDPSLIEHAAALAVGSDPVDPAQETDVWTGGYNGRAMIPGFVGCIVLTALATVILYPYLARRMPAYREWWNLAVLGIAGCAWVFHVFRWAYRTITVSYRITSRRVFLDRGCLYPTDEVVHLTQVARVEVVRNPIDRLFGVGTLRLVMESAEPPPIVLGGIPNPVEIANLVRQQILTARDASVRLERVGTGLEPPPFDISSL